MHNVSEQTDSCLDQKIQASTTQLILFSLSGRMLTQPHKYLKVMPLWTLKCNTCQFSVRIFLFSIFYTFLFNSWLRSVRRRNWSHSLRFSWKLVLLCVYKRQQSSAIRSVQADPSLGFLATFRDRFLKVLRWKGLTDKACFLLIHKLMFQVPVISYRLNTPWRYSLKMKWTSPSLRYGCMYVNMSFLFCWVMPAQIFFTKKQQPVEDLTKLNRWGKNLHTYKVVLI